MGGAGARVGQRQGLVVVPVLSWQGLLDCGQSVGASELDARAAGVKPGHCATLIYTSGTTGNPKAVMMSHDNLIFESAAVYEHAFAPLNRTAKPDHFRGVSYLPLSHVAAQMLDIIFPLCISSDIGRLGASDRSTAERHATIWFARPDALKGTLKQTLVACRPTMFLGVPRVWEKIRETMMEIGRSTTGLKKQVAEWARRARATQPRSGSSAATARGRSRISSHGRWCCPRSKRRSASTSASCACRARRR